MLLKSFQAVMFPNSNSEDAGVKFIDRQCGYRICSRPRDPSTSVHRVFEITKPPGGFATLADPVLNAFPDRVVLTPRLNSSRRGSHRAVKALRLPMAWVSAANQFAASRSIGFCTHKILITRELSFMQPLPPFLS